MGKKNKKEKTATEGRHCVLCGAVVKEEVRAYVIGATGRVVCRDCVDISSRIMQIPDQRPVSSRIPRTPLLPAYCPKKGFDSAPDMLMRLKIREKLPRLICRLSQTGSRKKLMVEEVNAMAMITRKAAMAGR